MLLLKHFPSSLSSTVIDIDTFMQYVEFLNRSNAQHEKKATDQIDINLVENIFHIKGENSRINQKLLDVNLLTFHNKKLQMLSAFARHVKPPQINLKIYVLCGIIYPC